MSPDWPRSSSGEPVAEDGRPTPSSLISRISRSARRFQADLDAFRLGVLEDIIKRFLSNTVKTNINPGRKPADILQVRYDLQAAAGLDGLQPGSDSGTQPDFLQDRRAKLEDQKTDFICFSGEAGKPAEYLYQARTAYRRIPWLETPAVQYGLAGFAVLVFVLGVLVTSVKLLRRNARGYRLAGLISGLNLVFLVSLRVILLPVATGGGIWQFSFAPSLQLRMALALPLAALPLAAGLLFTTIQSWREGSQSVAQSVFNTMLLAGLAAWLVFLQTWNLLGWRFNNLWLAIFGAYIPNIANHNKKSISLTARSSL